MDCCTFRGFGHGFFQQQCSLGCEGCPSICSATEDALEEQLFLHWQAICVICLTFLVEGCQWWCHLLCLCPLSFFKRAKMAMDAIVESCGKDKPNFVSLMMDDPCFLSATTKNGVRIAPNNNEQEIQQPIFEALLI